MGSAHAISICAQAISILGPERCIAARGASNVHVHVWLTANGPRLCERASVGCFSKQGLGHRCQDVGESEPGGRGHRRVVEGQEVREEGKG